MTNQYTKEFYFETIYEGLDYDWQATSLNQRIRALILSISLFIISMLNSFEGICTTMYCKRKVAAGFRYPAVLDVTDKCNYIEIDGVKIKFSRVLHNIVDNVYEVEVNDTIKYIIKK